MLSVLLARETWLGRPEARRRWLLVAAVVGLIVAVFHAPPTAYVLSDLGLPTGWGAAGFALLFALVLAVGSGMDHAGVLVGVAAAGIPVVAWIAPDVLWASPMESYDRVWLALRWTRNVSVLGVAGYLVGTIVRRLVAFARRRGGQTASAPEG